MPNSRRPALPARTCKLCQLALHRLAAPELGERVLALQHLRDHLGVARRHRIVQQARQCLLRAWRAWAHQQRVYRAEKRRAANNAQRIRLRLLRACASHLHRVGAAAASGQVQHHGVAPLRLALGAEHVGRQVVRQRAVAAEVAQDVTQLGERHGAGWHGRQRRRCQAGLAERRRIGRHQQQQRALDAQRRVRVRCCQLLRARQQRLAVRLAREGGGARGACRCSCMLAASAARQVVGDCSFCRALRWCLHG